MQTKTNEMSKHVLIRLESKAVYMKLHVIRDKINFLFRADENDDSDLRVVMDQKAYLEEINRNLK